MLGRRTNSNRNGSPSVPLHAQSSSHLRSQPFFETPIGRVFIAACIVVLVIWTLMTIFTTSSRDKVEPVVTDPMAFCSDLSLSISAHRGGGYTLGDMRAAVTAGARAMDIDVWRSIDGVLFVGHLSSFTDFIHGSMPTQTIYDPTMMTAQQIEDIIVPSHKQPIDTAATEHQQQHQTIDDGSDAPKFVPPTLDVSPDTPSLPRLEAVLAFVAREPRMEQVTLELKLSGARGSKTPITSASSAALAAMVLDIGRAAEHAALTSTYHRIVIIDSGLAPNDFATIRRTWPMIGIAAVWRSDVHSTSLQDWTNRLPFVDMAMPSVDHFPLSLAKVTIAQFGRPRPDQLIAARTSNTNGAIVPRRIITAWMVNDHDAFMKALHLGARVIITDDVAAMVGEYEAIRSQCSSTLQQAIS